MDNISHLNMPGFSGGQSSSTSITVLNICICCLGKNVPLVNLTNCKHAEFFEYILRVKLDYSATFVCYACHGTLKDIYQFKRQVEDSLSNLNKQVKNLDWNNTKLSKLTHADIEIFHTQNSQPLEKEVIKIKTEVKIEIELEQENSDPENNVPLSMIKEKDKGPKTPFFLNRNPENDIPLWVIHEKNKDPKTLFFSNRNPDSVPLPVIKEKNKDPNVSFFSHRDPRDVPIPMIKEKLKDPNISSLSHRDVTNDPLWVSTEKYKDPNTPFLVHRAPENDVPLQNNTNPNISFSSHRDLVTGDPLWVIAERNKDPNIPFLIHRAPENNVPLQGIKENNTDPNTSFLSHRVPENVPLPEIKEKDKDPNTPYFVRKYQGKIKLVDLNKDEMWEERRKEAVKQKYLKLPYKCESCIVGFSLEPSLEEHMEKRHTETSGSVTCAICKVTTSVAGLEKHLKRHYRRVDCGVCGARYNTMDAAQAHYDKMHETSPKHKCEECGYTTNSQRNLRRHRDSHKGKVSCDQCGKQFVNSMSLKEHKKTIHKATNRTYSCAECSKVYRVSASFLAHTRAAHGADSGAYCQPCNKHFRNKTCLKTHLNTSSKHAGENDKKFVCSECDARFFMERQLKDHVEWKHLKNNKHKCDECNKVYKSSTALRYHIKCIHEKNTPPKNKICDHCGRGFTTTKTLRTHIRTHTGERPLACAHCPATFAHPAARYTHNKLIHKQKTKLT